MVVDGVKEGDWVVFGGSGSVGGSMGGDGFGEVVE